MAETRRMQRRDLGNDPDMETVEELVEVDRGNLPAVNTNNKLCNGNNTLY